MGLVLLAATFFAMLFEIDEDPEFKMHNPGYENDLAAYTNMVKIQF